MTIHHSPVAHCGGLGPDRVGHRGVSKSDPTAAAVFSRYPTGSKPLLHLSGRMLLSLALISSWTLPSPAQQTGTGKDAGIEDARLVKVLNLDGPQLHFHVQGIDLDQTHVWVTSVDKQGHKGYLHQFDRATGKLERQVEITDGPRYHPGGFSLAGDSLWIPVAEYTAHSSAVIEEIDAKTLVVKRKIPIADHLSCVAVTSDSLIAGNWDSRQFYVLDFSGKQRALVENPSTNTSYQEIKFVDGMLMASGPLSHTTGSIDWYTWPSLKLVRSLRASSTDRNKAYSAEGVAIKGTDLYVLPEDGPDRYFHFVLEK